MATPFSSLVTSVRFQLNETSAVFWSDAEILGHLQKGAKDLWRRINDLYENHFNTLDETNMSIAAAGDTTVTGVPADLHRIVEIEPRTLGDSSTTPGLTFKPADYQSDVFREARARGNVQPKNVTIYYTLLNAGGPVAAPTIKFAPSVTAAVLLACMYVPTLADSAMTLTDDNPVSGESDNALIAWGIAYSRAKEREDRSPDPEWLAIYATEKTNIVSQIGPRQIQEPEIAEGLFEGSDNLGES